MNFIDYINSLHTEENKPLIETITKAYRLCFENEEEKVHEKKLTFKFRNSDDSVKEIFDLFKSGNRGVLLLDPDGDMDEPVAAFVTKEHKPNAGTYTNRFRTYEMTITKDDDEDDDSKMKKCEIVVKSNDKEDAERTINNFKNLFDNIGKIGNSGHSYGIKFVPNNDQAKIQNVGWDGDGSDFIDTKSIKIH